MIGMQPAKVVIIGGGIAGTSVAANLARLSRFEEGDIFLFEARELGGGTTSYSAGMCSNTMMDSEPEVVLNKLGMQGVLEFKERFGRELTFNQCGNLLLALTDEDAVNCEKQAEMQMGHGIKTEMLTKHEVERRFPYINAAEVKSGMFCPNDGYVDVAQMVAGYANFAKYRGVNIFPQMWVSGVEVGSDGIFSVHVNRRRGDRVDTDTFFAEKVVNAAGALSPEISAMVNIRLPVVLKTRSLWSVEINELSRSMPLVAIEGNGHQHQHSYIRRDGNRYLVGVGPMGDFTGEIKDFRMDVRPEGGEAVAGFVRHFFPKAEVGDMNGHAAIRAHAGIRAHAPEGDQGGPLIGPYNAGEGPKNWLECSRWGGAGVQLSSATEILAEFIMEGRIRGEMEAFLPKAEGVNSFIEQGGKEKG